MDSVTDELATVNGTPDWLPDPLLPDDEHWGPAPVPVELSCTDPKVEYLADLRVQELRDDAHRILAGLDASRRALSGTRVRLQQATEAVEMAEASLMMSDAYAAGKNAEVRRAWLLHQRESDPALAEALGAKRRLELEMAVLDTDLDAAAHEWQLRIAELRLISAQLLFLAGGA